jgi:outer membrane protein assembly factor BamB
MVGDDLVVVTESGKVVLVEVTPKQAREVARFQAIQGKTWNHPLINRGRLYIRNGEEAACYDLSL